MVSMEAVRRKRHPLGFTLGQIWRGNWAMRIPIWLQLTLLVFIVAFGSLLVLVIVASVKSWDYGSDLMSSRLEAVAAMKGVQLEQTMQNMETDIAWMFGRDPVLSTLAMVNNGSITSEQWQLTSQYLNNMITSKQGCQAILLYDTNFTQIYSLEHADSASSLSSLLAAMSRLLPYQQQDLFPNISLTTSLLAGPVPLSAVNKIGAYSLSVSMPITAELAATTESSNITRTKRDADDGPSLVGYGAVVWSAQFIQDEISWNFPQDGGNIVLGEKTKAESHVEFEYIFPSSSENNRPFSFDSFPTMKLASDLPDTTVTERARGSDLKTTTDIYKKSSVGYSYANMLQRKWLVTFVVSREQAYQPVNSFRNRAIGTGFGVLGLLLLIIVPVGRGFTSPLYTIYQSMELKRGDAPKRKALPYVWIPSPSIRPRNGSSSGKSSTLYPVNDSIEEVEPAEKEFSSQRDYPSEFHVPKRLPVLKRQFRDELDDLVDEYNAMIDKLNNQYMFLGDQVRSRTKEAQQARLLAEAANNAKSKFIANITHELRTPLNGIMGMTSVSLSEQNVDKIRANLRVILESGRVLMELLNELLAFSKNQLDMVPEITAFTPADILRSIDTMFKTRAEVKSLAVTMAAQPPEISDIQLYGDSYRTIQVIINFMSNAIKFSERRGSLSLLVHLHPDYDEHIKLGPYSKSHGEFKPPYAMLEVVVADCGPGMSQQQLKNIFEPFTQGDESLSKRHEGTGLGMSMCKQLSEGIGGYVTVCSAEGRGLLASVKVPVHVESPVNLRSLPVPDPLPYYEKQFYTESLNTGVVRACTESKRARPRPTIEVIPPKLGVVTTHARHSSRPSLSRGLFLEPHSHRKMLSSATRSTSTPVSSHATANSMSTNFATPDQHPRYSGQLYSSESESETFQSPESHLPAPATPIFGLLPSSSPNDLLTAEETEFTAQEHPDLRVLVADDNALNLKILSNMLKRMGVGVVDTAQDGETVIRLVEKAIKDGVHYTVIFMDLVMPRVNGLEAAQVIRGTMGYPYPIVAITGFSDEKTTNMCVEANIQGLLVKPIMRNTVARMLFRYYNQPHA